MDYELLKDIAEFRQAGIEKDQNAIGAAMASIAGILEQLGNEYGDKAVQSVMRDLVAAGQTGDDNGR